ncbi:hypothetical protein LCGC14_1827780 [marine sediment metagenome]|uniref:Uncharacterized protein n=1 Tax=marine sediment metagenome TaxID=412755 RepID=A0A0F9JGI7_9ZZZZ
MSELSRGQHVVFFQGRRPMKGVVEEVQDDGRVVLVVKTDGGATRIIKDGDEVKPVEEVKGKQARIRFHD